MVSPLPSLRVQNAKSVTHSALRGSTLNCSPWAAVGVIGVIHVRERRRAPA
jgi:hypothetical protein